MKKYIIAIITLSFLVWVPAKALDLSYKIGASLDVGMFETSGSESEKSGNVGPETNTKTMKEGFGGASVFAELGVGYGISIGVDYIPGSISLGSGSREDVSSGADIASEADTGTRTASANADNLLAIYATFPLMNNFYGRVGMMEVDVTTEETLPNGTYGNVSVDGWQAGIGVNMTENASLEIVYTDFDAFTLASSSGSTSVTADPEVIAARFKYAIGN
tara:strand:- start:143 stop:799 length:657 start_codon:yes stop_codon:yes gene_type:complete